MRIIDIQNRLLNVVGWQQSYNTSDINISEALIASESGLYFQNSHPLVTCDNLMSVAPNFANILYPVYDEEKAYIIGEVVKYEELLYKAVKESIGQIPEIGSTYWIETNPFSEWLENKIKASIQKAISRYCTEKIVNNTYKVLCENKVLFDGTGRLVDTVPNTNNLVGFEIVPIRSMGVTTKINRIGLQFTEAGNYTLYLLHSGLDKQYKALTFTKTTKNSIEWFNLDNLYLPYKSEDVGGSWYLCYFQSDLPENSKAIKKDRDWSKEPCSACSRREWLSWQAWSKYLEIHPFSIEEDLVNRAEPSDISLWDVEHNVYTYDNNYGINLDVTVECDITDFIIEQRLLFQDVIQKQFAVDMLREFAYNPNVRTNRHSINASRTEILYELDGDSGSLKKSGLNYQLDLAFKAISLVTEGLDRVCLPCKNNGIKYRTV